MTGKKKVEAPLVSAKTLREDFTGKEGPFAGGYFVPNSHWTAEHTQKFTVFSNRLEEYVPVGIQFEEGWLIPRENTFPPDPIRAAPTNAHIVWRYAHEGFPLRGEQEETVDYMIRHFCCNASGLLVAPCGSGKTILGLAIAKHLKQRTCILVHKVFLMNQWIARIKEYLNIDAAIWQSGETPPEGASVVVAMVQSITSSKKKYPDALYDSFGLVIVDEVHRHSAPVWQKAILHFTGKYRLGLTATPYRKDGLERVIFEHISPVSYIMKRVSVKVQIYKVKLNTFIPPERYTFPWNGEIDFSTLDTILSNREDRTKVIIDYAVRAVAKGRKVFILSSRRDHVKDMVAKLTAQGVSAGPYVGGMSEDALDDSSYKDVVVGTYQMAEEGLDIPDLDTLFFATPRTSITQAVGRILREFPGKEEATVIDFVDHQIPVLENLWRSREKRYNDEGFFVAKSC